MKQIKPLISFDSHGWEEDVEDLLNFNPSPPPGESRISDPENWVLLEGRQHGNYSYPNLFVYIHRLGYSPEVEKIAQKLGMKVQNTQREKDGTDYIGNINYEEGIKLNSALENTTLNLRQGLDLRADLKDAMVGSKTLLDARSQVVRSERLKIFYDEIFEVRSPWRAEWLNASFKEVNGVLNIFYNYKLANRQLVADNEALEEHLKKNCYIETGSANKQGIPIRESGTKELYYWYPRAGKVAGFVADSGRAYLLCGRFPSCRYASLGVFACAEGAGAKKN